jgi:chromosome segregation ATPase
MDATKETSERRRKTKAEPGAVVTDDLFARDSAGEPPETALEASEAENAQPGAPQEVLEAAYEPEAASHELASEQADASMDAAADATNLPADRKRIEEQLEVLKRKESELRRALAIADHPELAEAIRVLEGRAYAVTRVEIKMAQGLSKAEERRRETLDKKLSSLQDKRAELDAQIREIEAQLAPLGVERTRAFEVERREALEQLIAALSHHHDALLEAGLDAASLVPDIARWMPEVVAFAEKLASQATARADV